MTERRTARDFALVIKRLVDLCFPEADKIVLVLDNLNTHTAASLYEVFAPAEAKRLADKIELGVVSRQCLDRHIPDVTTLKGLVNAWIQARNNAKKHSQLTLYHERRQNPLKENLSDYPTLTDF